MIKHRLEDKNGPIYHEVKYPISKRELQRVRLLLDFKSFEIFTDEELEKFGIVKDSAEYIFGVSFNDGATLDWKLCSGSSNYFDEVTFQYPDGRTADLDPTFELDDIEIDAGTDIYVVKLEIQDEIQH